MNCKKSFVIVSICAFAFSGSMWANAHGDQEQQQSFEANLQLEEGASDELEGGVYRLGKLKSAGKWEMPEWLAKKVKKQEERQKRVQEEFQGWGDYGDDDESEDYYGGY